MKRKYLMVFIFVIVFCNNAQSVSAWATNAETKTGVIVIEYSNNEGSYTNTIAQSVDVLTNRIETKAEKPPTKTWNWDSGVYRYRLDGVTDYTITNYAFRPDENGCLSISTDGLNTNGGNITISLYRSGTLFQNVVSSWTGNPQSIQGLGFNGLNPDKVYYFSFTVSNGVTANGEGIIHHP